MRAYRMLQQQGKESANASSSRAAEEASQLSEAVARSVASAASRGAGEITLRTSEVGRVDQALKKLKTLSKAIADFDTGGVLERSYKAPKALRGRFPTLENFAVIGSADLVTQGESLVAVVEELVKMRRASAREESSDDDDDDE